MVSPLRRKRKCRSALYRILLSSNGQPRASTSAWSWLLSPARVPISSQTSGGLESAVPRAAASGKRDLFLRLWRTVRFALLLTLVVPPAAEHCDGVQKAPMIGEPAAMLVEHAADLDRVEEAGLSSAR